MGYKKGKFTAVGLKKYFQAEQGGRIERKSETDKCRLTVENKK